jgi:hypothetical protein
MYFISTGVAVPGIVLEDVLERAHNSYGTPARSPRQAATNSLNRGAASLLRTTHGGQRPLRVLACGASIRCALIRIIPRLRK